MIKYLGSKRTLVPALGNMARALQARTAVDLFTGTTRVAQEYKRSGIHVTAVDIATYSHTLACCYITADATTLNQDRITDILADLAALPGEHGYFTETFCVQSRFFQPKNGMKVDAIRNALTGWAGTPEFPVPLAALTLAADRVDSTTGIQMVYLKQWATRAHNDLELRLPTLIAGTGTALLADAVMVPTTMSLGSRSSK